MGKILTYTNITKSCYIESSDELEYFGDDFDYEVSYDKLYNALTEIIYDDYFTQLKKLGASDDVIKSVKSSLRSLVSDLDCTDGVFDNYEDALKEYFEEDAFEYIRG